MNPRHRTPRRSAGGRARRGASGERGGHSVRALAGVFALFVLILASAAHAAGPQFPPLTGRVVDDAHVLTPQVQQDLTAKLAALEAKTSRCQLVVPPLPTPGRLRDRGLRLSACCAPGRSARRGSTTARC